MHPCDGRDDRQPEAVVAGRVAARRVAAIEAVQIAQIRAKKREATAKALNALAERYDATLAALQQAEANERAWIRRLQDEDDFFLLAA